LSSILLFLSQCYLHDRELTSFPTRRSSDLMATAMKKYHTGVRYDTSDFAFLSSEAIDYDNKAFMLRVRDTVRNSFSEISFQKTRSEEHTSELQSRENLVCRLMLEKKKYDVL